MSCRCHFYHTDRVDGMVIDRVVIDRVFIGRANPEFPITRVPLSVGRARVSINGDAGYFFEANDALRTFLQGRLPKRIIPLCFRGGFEFENIGAVQNRAG